MDSRPVIETRCVLIIQCVCPVNVSNLIKMQFFSHKVYGHQNSLVANILQNTYFRVQLKNILNNTRVNKWLQNFHFGETVPIRMTGLTVSTEEPISGRLCTQL